ncbi:helix-turn-helix domain-containing protein [Streptomyces sp. NBC_01336]|uniref:helix-turn-helix domain-containing protein n=1 Tax=Streptomyces sp. NBC_01336 TaxID=2903829 RepID=UPI002E1249C8|nr:helix-turn-helix domain-containing protein [Streptomyces sp. NBC_01336]
MRSVPALRLYEGDRARLEALTRMSTAPAGLVRRARIVLLAAEGASNTEIAAQLRVSRPTVIKWRSRYMDSGIAALGDLPRPGRPATVDEVAVLVATLADGARPPARLRAPYWSSRLLADELGIAHSTVARVWRKWGVRPHRPETFQLPSVPPLPPGVHRGVVGVFRASSWNAVVLRADERTGHRAEERFRPLLVDRAGPGADCASAPAAFLNLLDAVAQAHPYPRLHVLMNGTGAMRSRGVREWLLRNPRVSLHHAPATRSWADLTEVSLRLAGAGHRSTSSIHRHPGTTHGPDVGPRPL